MASPHDKPTKKAKAKIPSPLERVMEDKAISFTESTMFTVEVGAAASLTKFSVHEEIIGKQSEFFKRAMNGHWRTANRVITLTDVDPIAFRNYLNFVYRNQLPIVQSENITPENAKGYMNDEYARMTEVYLLAERFQDVHAKNTIVIGILNLAKRSFGDGQRWFVPSADIVTSVYEGTVEGNKCRELIVDLWTYFSAGAVDSNNQLDNVPHDFMKDLLKQVMAGKVRFARATDGQQYLEDVDIE